uniref:Uncharacterized protein n=1 Tax=Romanomermis culicivorax TaxID=13658 RepID=A0A915JGM6_ROMCU
STRVAFIIISEAVKSGFEPVKDVTQPGALFLNPKLDKFKQSRRILGRFAAQCSCSVSEDCSTENGKTIKNCHFNMDGREERCTMTVELRLEQPLQRFHVPTRVRALPSCWPNAT